MPVGEMLARMPASELTEWMAFFRLRANPPQPQQSPSEARSVLEAMVRPGVTFQKRKKR